MALIGSIAISMQADTAGLSRGLSRSSSMVQSWSSGASRDFAAGSRAIMAGLNQIGSSAAGVGLLLADAFKNSAAPKLAAGLAITAGELVGKAARPITSSFAHVFDASAKAAAPRLAALGGMAASAGKATTSSLAQAYGGLDKRLGGPFSKAAALVKRATGSLTFGALKIETESIAKGFGKVATGAGGVAVGLGKIGWNVGASMASKFASSLVSVGAGLAKLGAVAGVAAAAVGVKAGAAAAHLEEAYNKTDQVFGKHGANVIAQANKMADAYGTERQAYLDGTAAVGGQLQGVGYAEKDAAALSVQLANLAADAAAFRDVGFEESLTKIRAGLSGESEPLKAWGIMIDDNAVKTKALAMGLVQAGKEMDNSAKVQARLALIQEGLAKDSGALARESTGTAAQINEVWGRMAHMMETIGQTTAPILGAALQGINTAIVAVEMAWTDASSAVLSWFGYTADSLEGAGEGVGIFQAAVGYMANAWDFARGVVASFFGYVESGLATVTGWIAKLLDGLHSLGAGEWAASARDALQGYSDAAKANAEAAGEYAARAFEQKSAATVDSYWTKAKAKIDAARDELAGAKADEVGKPKASDGAGSKAKSTGRKAEFAEAARMNSKEAASIVLRSRYGLSKDGAAEAAKQTAANTKEIVPALRDVASAVKSAAAPTPVVIL